jgi:hypothetical protein
MDCKVKILHPCLQFFTPVLIGASDVVQSIRFGRARRNGGVSCGRDSGLTQDPRARVPRLNDAPPRRRTSPAPEPSRMARVTSRNDDQGPDSAHFGAVFHPFPVLIGASDVVQSTAWEPPRRIGGVSVGGAANDPGLCPYPRYLRARFRDLKDAPTCEEDQSSTEAIQNGEGDLPNWRPRCGVCPLCRWF